MKLECRRLWGMEPMESVSSDAIWWDLIVATHQSRMLPTTAAAWFRAIPENALAIEVEAVEAVAFPISGGFWPTGAWIWEEEVISSRG